MLSNIPKNTALSIILLCSIHNISSDHHEEFDTVRKKIHTEFIDESTENVARKANKKKSIEKEFQKYLDNDSMMQKIQQIYADGSSGTGMESVHFVESVKKDFEEKSEELTDQLANAGWYRCGSESLVLLGLGMFLGGAISQKAPIAAAGGLSLIIGGYGSYRNRQKIKTLPVHIKVVNKMEEKWEGSFLIIKSADK